MQGKSIELVPRYPMKTKEMSLLMDFQSLKFSYLVDFEENILSSWDFSSNIKASNPETLLPDYYDSFSYSSECILHFLYVLKKLYINTFYIRPCVKTDYCYASKC